MLDLKWIRETPDALDAALARRGAAPMSAAILDMDKRHRETVTELQGLQSRRTWCVSLNQSERIDPARIIGEYQYEHPLFTLEGVAAQERLLQRNGSDHTWFCGAWLRNGFHEDGVYSALQVAHRRSGSRGLPRA